LICKWSVIKIKAVIFYFSGTGNTWWVANQIAEKLTQSGIETKKYSIEAEEISDNKKVQALIEEATIVGFGYPIFGSDLPLTFNDFIKSLSKNKGKQAFVFTTMMYFSGDGALVAARKLKMKGFKVKQATNIRMPNNVKLPYPIIRSFPMSSEKGITKLKEKASKKADKLVKKIVEGKRWLQGWDPINVSGGLMQRVPMKFIGWAKWARNYYVDMETCTECMLCVEYCPTNNIRFENEEFIWGDDCNICLRCYNLCPEDAIQYKEATLNKERYTRYKGPGNGFNQSKLKE